MSTLQDVMDRVGLTGLRIYLEIQHSAELSNSEWVPTYSISFADRLRLQPNVVRRKLADLSAWGFIERTKTHTGTPLARVKNG